MKTVMRVKNKETGELNVAVYATTPAGNLRYFVDGHPISDKKFDQLYQIISEVTSIDYSKELIKPNQK